jgi:hypothetical protein
MKIRLMQCFDVDLLDGIIRNSAVYPFVSDDACPAPDDFTCRSLVEDEKNIFVLVYDDFAPVGCFAFLGNELHTCMLLECRGRNAVDAGNQAIAYFFEKTGAVEVTSFAFEEMPQTLWYAKALGFQRDGEPFKHTQTRGGLPLTRINFKKEKS